MSKRAEEVWESFKDEKPLSGSAALQRLATSVFVHWRGAMNAEQHPDLVGLGQIHDIWNLMYRDMKAIYTLEKLVGVDYKAEMMNGNDEDS